MAHRQFTLKGYLAKLSSWFSGGEFVNQDVNRRHTTSFQAQRSDRLRNMVSSRHNGIMLANRGIETSEQDPIYHTDVILILTKIVSSAATDEQS